MTTPLESSIGATWSRAQQPDNVSVGGAYAMTSAGAISPALRANWSGNLGLSCNPVIARFAQAQAEAQSWLSSVSVGGAYSAPLRITYSLAGAYTDIIRSLFNLNSAFYPDFRGRWDQLAAQNNSFTGAYSLVSSDSRVAVSRYAIAAYLEGISSAGYAFNNSPVEIEIKINDILYKIIPNRRVYFVSNSVSVVKLPERIPLECFKIGLSLDSGSWGWSVQAAIDPAQLALINPEPHNPVEIEITLNETETFVVMITGFTRSRAFGKNEILINGVSRAAWLAAPLAPVATRLHTSDKTAQQLMNDALLAAPYAGPTGFSLNWGITDWLVPAQAFSHTGTPMEYLNEIANAVGATVQAHRSDYVLNIASLFTTPAWQWQDTAPNVIVPISAVIVDSLQFDDLPDINAVTLTGGSVAGIVDSVKRTGSAGDKTLLPINHSLFTSISATRQRAGKELSQTGRRWRSSITMPVYSEFGVIDSNKLLQINEGATSNKWKVAGVRVEANLPRITQTLDLERYEYLV